MLHDILFSLWQGCSDVFLGDDEDRWAHEEWKKGLHPGERELLHKVMKVAHAHNKIIEFQKLVANGQTVQDKKTLNRGEEGDCPQEKIVNGFYMKSFCDGLDKALKSYRNEIIKLEETVLRYPDTNLTHIFASLQRYVQLFDCLNAMIRTVKVEQISGCLLIGILHMHTLSGIPQIMEAANTIMKSINALFYKQLADWIIYGNLVDEYHEFFIEDCNCDDDTFMYPEQIEAGQGELDSSSALVKKPWRIRKFTIKTKMLPSTLPIEMAETILFVGRIVWIMQNDPSQNKDVFQKFKRDVWGGSGYKYYMEILKMQNSNFNLQQFQRTITNCRLQVTKYLSKMMVEEAQLLEHLQWFRDYYALGRGELFQEFIVVADKQEPANPYYVRNLNAIFEETARKIYTENDESYQKFELALPKDFDWKKNDNNPLLNLELYLGIRWPLHIIFHPKIISLYNKLFGFLLRVKKTHINLKNVWLKHTVGKPNIDKTVWTLRHNLILFVNNVQFYLQVDVIETQFSKLKEAIQNAYEFKDIFRLHSTFLSKLLSQTFIMVADEKQDEQGHHGLYQLPIFKEEPNNTVFDTILKLLELCDKFCVMANLCDTKLSEMERNRFVKMHREFDVTVKTLLCELNSLNDNVSGTHLLKLLHRISFNLNITAPSE